MDGEQEHALDPLNFLSDLLNSMDQSTTRQDARQHAEESLRIGKALLPENHLLLASSKRVLALILEEIAIDTQQVRWAFCQCFGSPGSGSVFDIRIRIQQGLLSYKKSTISVLLFNVFYLIFKNCPIETFLAEQNTEPTFLAGKQISHNSFVIAFEKMCFFTWIRIRIGEKRVSGSVKKLIRIQNSG